MRITNSTPTNEIQRIGSIGEIKSVLIKNANLSKEDTDTLVESASGKSIVTAMKNHGIYNEKESGPSNQSKFRSRLSTGLLTLVRFILQPVLAAVTEENEKLAVIESKKLRAEKIEQWKANGCLGRKPKGVDSPSILEIKNALREANLDARQKHDCAPRARVAFKIMREYHETLIKLFTKKLHDLDKAGVELPDTIENLVEKYVIPIDEANLSSREIEMAILEGYKNADRKVREQIGAGGVGRIADELAKEYNSHIKSAFKDELREIKEAHGSLPKSMDDLTEEHVSLYTIDGEAPAQHKPKPKNVKKATTKPKAKTHKTPAKVTEIIGNVETEAQNEADEAEANAMVAAGATE